MEKDPKVLISEEQRIVDDLVAHLQKEITDADQRLEKILMDFKKAKAMGPDAYGMLVDANRAKKDVIENRSRAMASKDELYETRVVLAYEDEDGSSGEEEYKIGLHSYGKGGDLFVVSWMLPLFRNFILGEDDYTHRYKDKKGETSTTSYHLRMKRNIKMRFSHVKNVMHMFPLTDEEAEKLIFDEFLQELADRRANEEFKNIVFSIQKRQAEIIKAPFKENLIVQGCAGSGKSMIMLHRLPIIMYDNQAITRNNVYIISPSETYIQMAEEMREQLEISDLQMGTLNQYYDYVLSKYQVDKAVYGTVNYRKELSSEQESYIYGPECITDMRSYVEGLFKEGKVKYAELQAFFGLTNHEPANDMPDTVINSILLNSNAIMDANTRALRQVFALIKDALQSLRDLKQIVANKKTTVLRNIAKSITSNEDEIEEKQTELLMDTNLGEIAQKNRRDAIEVALAEVERLKLLRAEIEEDTAYFDNLIAQSECLTPVFEAYSDMDPVFEKNEWQRVYEYIEKIKSIVKAYSDYSVEVAFGREKYLDYTESLKAHIDNIREGIMALCNIDVNYLSSETYASVLDENQYYLQLKESLPNELYCHIMEKLGQVPDKKGKLEGLSCSPYIYTQIMYVLRGAPNAAKERLICIDEAQGLAPEELRLIRAINDERLVFNLYGDENQHIEGTKGVDRWSEFAEVLDVEPKLLNENYRNARQITLECNRRFGMEMLAINLDGNGVHTVSSQEEFVEKVTEAFTLTTRVGLKAIIVQNAKEARYILEQFAMYKEKIHDMTGEEFSFHRTRWNLLTVAQSKGLEFGTVVAVSGHMSRNEKYIAYTRALDELFNYDEDFVLPEEPVEVEEPEEKRVEEKQVEVKEKKPVEKAHVEEPKKEAVKPRVSTFMQEPKRDLKAFFESKGLTVKDMRGKGGPLWVIGGKQQIKPIVDEACKKFGVTGVYTIGRAIGFRQGCYFKTNK